MKTGEISEAEKSLLSAFANLQDRHEAPTVQNAAILAGLNYLETYEMVNQLFLKGLLAHDLRVTDDGRKAAA